MNITQLKFFKDRLVIFFEIMWMNHYRVYRKDTQSLDSLLLLKIFVFLKEEESLDF